VKEGPPPHGVCIYSPSAGIGPVGQPAQPPELYFSLSNNIAIVGTFEGPDGLVDATDDLVVSFNGNLVLRVDRQIYARGDDFTYFLLHHEGPMPSADLLADRASRRDPEPG
jgi:hypothetical protein